MKCTIPDIGKHLLFNQALAAFEHKEISHGVNQEHDQYR
jgi:hypothetical protein